MTDDTAPRWPENKLPLGLLKGYRYQDRPRHSRTAMASGPARTRLTSHTPVRDFYFELLLNDGQLANFEAWLERDLEGGTRWFWLPLRDASGINLTLVQFHKLTGPRMQGGRWLYACQCISYQRKALALNDEQLDLLLNYKIKGLQQTSIRLHNLVHGGW